MNTFPQIINYIVSMEVIQSKKRHLSANFSHAEIIKNKFCRDVSEHYICIYPLGGMLVGIAFKPKFFYLSIGFMGPSDSH